MGQIHCQSLLFFCAWCLPPCSRCLPLSSLRWLSPPCPKQEAEHAYIRLNFNLGGSYEPSAKFPNQVFLKELSFRSPDFRRATKVVQEVKTLRSLVMQRERERAERATLVQQERLIRSKVRS